MSRLGSVLKKIYLAVTSITVIAVFTTATYAWFSTNRITTTNLVSSKTDTREVTLLLSPNPGGSATGAGEVAITRLNADVSKQLMPVSTADLNTFYFSPYTEEKNAKKFTKVDKDKFLYHGRIYLQAVAQGLPQEARLQLYLDESQYGGGSILQNAPGMARNALRIGLKFDNASPLILRTSEGANASADRFYNTMIDDQLIESNVVLVPSGDKVAAVADPSVPYTTYLVGENGLPADGSVKPLINLELNHEYAVDIYVYLEGCDPDCTNILELDTFDFHLGFYGILTEEVDG